jgi:hypothetical protein
MGEANTGIWSLLADQPRPSQLEAEAPVVIEVSGCSYCQEFEGTYAFNQATGVAPVPSFVRVHRPAPRRGYYLGTPEALLTSGKEEPRGCVSNPAPITTSELAQTRQNWTPRLLRRRLCGVA